MARGFDKLNVKSAVKSRNKFDLSRTHLTTMEFGQIVPLFCEEVVPGDKFSVDGTYFSRMAPLVKPTYGKFSFKTAEMFVPYYQVADGIDAWMVGNTTWEGQATASRFVTPVALVLLFAQNVDLATAVSAADVATGAWYDIKYKNTSGVDTYVKFTPRGRYFNKIFNSLGYTLPENADLREASTWYKTIGTTNMSALPFLAFAKAYNDWMSQSQRYNTSTLSALLKAIKHDVSYSSTGGTILYNATNHRVQFSGLYTILRSIKLCYENDYFTSAWLYPNSPIGTSYSPSTITGIPGDNGSLSIGNSNTSYIPETTFDLTADVTGSEEEDPSGVVDGNIEPQITQRALDWLKSFDDWVRRNNYSGSRAVQQVYSRFGIKTEDYRSNYAKLIDTQTIPVQVGDVTALSQDYVSAGSENNLELGDYAGKGITSGNGGFSVECNDYGMIFVLGYYTVDPMNVYGADRTVLRNTPLDYYTPEFDGVGADPISQYEVWSNPRVDSSVASNSVFGFTERYNSYRFGRDKITGDFRKFTLPSTSTYATTGTEMNVWHTGRMLTDIKASGNLLAQNPDFNTLIEAGSEFNRIFSITDESVDHFYLTAQFRVTAIRPMLNLNQVPKLGEGDTSVPRNGNEIN